MIDHRTRDFTTITLLSIVKTVCHFINPCSVMSHTKQTMYKLCIQQDRLYSLDTSMPMDIFTVYNEYIFAEIELLAIEYQEIKLPCIMLCLVTLGVKLRQ